MFFISSLPPFPIFFSLCVLCLPLNRYGLPVMGHWPVCVRQGCYRGVLCSPGLSVEVITWTLNHSLTVFLFNSICYLKKTYKYIHVHALCVCATNVLLCLIKLHLCIRMEKSISEKLQQTSCWMKQTCLQLPFFFLWSTSHLALGSKGEVSVRNLIPPSLKPQLHNNLQVALHLVLLFCVHQWKIVPYACRINKYVFSTEWQD